MSGKLFTDPVTSLITVARDASVRSPTSLLVMAAQSLSSPLEEPRPPLPPPSRLLQPHLSLQTQNAGVLQADVPAWVRSGGIVAHSSKTVTWCRLLKANYGIVPGVALLSVMTHGMNFRWP